MSRRALRRSARRDRGVYRDAHARRAIRTTQAYARARLSLRGGEQSLSSIQLLGIPRDHGSIAPEDPEHVVGLDGATIADGMREVGLDPTRVLEAKRDDLDYFIELHIEQGPLLEQAGVAVGIVAGITGPREYWVTLTGRSDHAGARPMDTRRDPMAGAAEIISGVINTAHRMGRPAVTTVGRITADPNLSPAVPEQVAFTVDARHPDPEQRAVLFACHETLMREVPFGVTSTLPGRSPGTTILSLVILSW